MTKIEPFLIPVVHQTLTHGSPNFWWPGCYRSLGINHDRSCYSDCLWNSYCYRCAEVFQRTAWSSLLYLPTYLTFTHMCIQSRLIIYLFLYNLQCEMVLFLDMLQMFQNKIIKLINHNHWYLLLTSHCHSPLKSQWYRHICKMCINLFVLLLYLTYTLNICLHVH